MGPKVRRTIEHGICLAVIAVAALLILAPAAMEHRAPVSLNALFDRAPWHENTPSTLRPSIPATASDPVTKFVPWYLFQHAAGISKDIFWNPYEATGIPFYALWRTRCLSPFSIPFYFLDPYYALSLSLLAKLLVAGYCAFYTARRFGFAASMSLYVALAFQLSSPFLFWSAWPMSDVLPWFPLFVIFCERLALGHFRTWALGTLTFVLMLAGGDPETVAMCLIFGLIVLIVRYAMTRGSATELAGGVMILIVSVALAGAVLAVQLAPFLEWVGQAAFTARPAMLAAPRPANAFAFFFPPYFSLADNSNTGGHPLTVSLLHVGLISTWLLLLWMALRPFAHLGERRRIDPLIAAAAIFTALGLIAHPLLKAFPPFAWINVEHCLAFNAFVLALTAGAAGEEWLQLKADDCADTLKRFAVALAAGGVLAAAIVLFNLDRPSWVLESATGAGFLVLLLALIGATLIYPSVRLLGYGMAVLAFLNLYPLANLNMAWTSRDAVYPATEFIGSLEETGQRVAGSDSLRDWPLSAHFISQAHASSGAELARHHAFVAAMNRDPLLARRVGAPYLVLTQSDIVGPFAQSRPHLRIKHVFASGAVLFEDPDGLPRTRLVYRGQAVEQFDPASLTAESDPLLELPEFPASEVEEPGTANVQHPETHTRVTVAADTPAGAVLVLADAWYPGWTATVNDAPADVFPVDGLFRGVIVPAGKSVVVFSYSPSNMKWALVVSGIGLLVLVLGLAYLVPGAIRNFRDQATWGWVETSGMK